MKVPSFQAVLFFEALPSTQKVTQRFPDATTQVTERIPYRGI